MNCTLSSLCRVLEPIQLCEVLEILHHDGTKKVGDWPQGFHIQELINVLIQFGYTATPFETAPVSRWPDGTTLGVIPWNGELVEVGSQRFDELVRVNTCDLLYDSELALIEGTSKRGIGHMCSKVGDKVYDGDKVYTLRQFLDSDFSITTVWKVFKVVV